MSDENKDQNLPARQASSLMGQLVRQRQAGDIAPAQSGNTGVQGQGQQGAVGSRGNQTGVQGGGQQTGVSGGGSAAAMESISRADIERIDRRDDGEYAQQA